MPSCCQGLDSSTESRGSLAGPVAWLTWWQLSVVPWSIGSTGAWQPGGGTAASVAAAAAVGCLHLLDRHLQSLWFCPLSLGEDND